MAQQRKDSSQDPRLPANHNKFKKPIFLSIIFLHCKPYVYDTTYSFLESYATNKKTGIG